MARLPEENHLRAATNAALLRARIRWVTQPKNQPLRRKLPTSDLAAVIRWQSRHCNQAKRFSILVLVLDSTAFLQRERLVRLAGLSASI